MSTATEERFWAKVSGADVDTCWEWMAATKAGYGVFYVSKRADGSQMFTPAHRWAYEALRCEIPPGLVIDHLCRNRACVNPWHLEPVTNQLNAERGLWGMRTHCPQGHPYDDTNTGRRQNRRGRECITCRSARNEARRQANRIALLDDPTLAQHGTLDTYNYWMCRCDPCRGAQAAYQRARRARVAS